MAKVKPQTSDQQRATLRLYYGRMVFTYEDAINSDDAQMIFTFDTDGNLTAYHYYDGAKWQSRGSQLGTLIQLQRLIQKQVVELRFSDSVLIHVTRRDVRDNKASGCCLQ